MLEELQAQCAVAREQHYLVRVRTKLAVQVRTLPADGSALFEVSLRDKARQRHVRKTLLVREVRGRVWSRAQNKWVEVRLWTSLSVEQASAAHQPEHLPGADPGAVDRAQRGTGLDG